MATKRILTDDTGQDIVKVLEIIAQNNIATQDMDWQKVNTIVANGAAEKAFAIGTQLVDTWTDTVDSKSYDVPWQVNNFETVTLEDGEEVPGMLLQSHYTIPFGVQFSHQRAFLACPDGLAAGTYYFDFAQSWGSNVKTGINYQFTLTKAVEKGGRLAGMYGAPDTSPSNWKIYSYGADGKTLNETVSITTGSNGTSIGTIPYQTRSGNLNSIQETAYGWNRWKTSALRQWLNSTKTKGNWWTPQDAWDIAPDQLTTKDGFLCGMPSDMLAQLKKFKTVTYANTVNDGGEQDITYDLVTIPSLAQMYIAPQIAGEGNVHKYWQRRSGRTSPCAQYQTYPNMISYSMANHTSAQLVRLRSAIRGGAFTTWYVNSSGYIDSNRYASYATACSPLVCI